MIFYVDYENVRLEGLKGIEKLSKDDTVYILNGNFNKEVIPFNVVRYMLSTNVKFVDTLTGANALDFQLIALLYNNLKETEEYYIVSKDQGYEPAIQKMSEVLGYSNVKRIGSIEKAFSVQTIDNIYLSKEQKSRCAKKLRQKYPGLCMDEIQSKGICTAIIRADAEDFEFSVKAVFGKKKCDKALACLSPDFEDLREMILREAGYAPKAPSYTFHVEVLIGSDYSDKSRIMEFDIEAPSKKDALKQAEIEVNIKYNGFAKIKTIISIAAI